MKFEDNHELLNDWEGFKKKCYEEFDKQDIYINKYRELCYKIHNNKEWGFTPIIQLII